MEKWCGKSALVTGANSGIGAAVTRKLLQLGMVVAGLDKTTNFLQELKLSEKEYGHRLFILNVDLSHEEEILRAFQWAEENMGGVDVLVNSAGIGGSSSLLEGNFSEWQKMVSVNIIALSICAKEAVKSMRKRDVKCGHIIHLSSNAAHIVPEYEPFHFYAATKHAVKALTEGLRQELKNINSPIRVTSISPGIVKTPILKNCLGDEVDKICFETNPYLQTEDIASTIEYVLGTPPHVQLISKGDVLQLKLLSIIRQNEAFISFNTNDITSMSVGDSNHKLKELSNDNYMRDPRTSEVSYKHRASDKQLVSKKDSS